MTKGFPPTTTPRPEIVSYMKVHLYSDLFPSEGIFRLITFCFHNVANRSGSCLIYMWQKVLTILLFGNLQNSVRISLAAGTRRQKSPLWFRQLILETLVSALLQVQ